MFIQKYEKDALKNIVCKECSSTSVLYQYGAITCRNCGMVIIHANKSNKYGAIKTVARDGLRRDSKFEASVADELWLRKKSGDIVDYDTQYKVVIQIYDNSGVAIDKITHKVDFRIHHLDGSYELYEAKGKETNDYRWRRRFLEKIWLKENTDHIYTVRKMRQYQKCKIKLSK